MWKHDGDFHQINYEKAAVLLSPNQIEPVLAAVSEATTTGIAFTLYG